MAKYTAQLQPDYMNDNYMIVVWFTSKLSLIEDLQRALKPLGVRELIDVRTRNDRNYDYFIDTECGGFRFSLEKNSLAIDGDAYSFRPHQNDRAIFAAHHALSDHSNFEIKENLNHPIIGEWDRTGFICLFICVFFWLLIALFSPPSLTGNFSGIKLAMIVTLVSTVVVAKFGGIGFILKRMSEKFPDPINPNFLALVFAFLHFAGFLMFLGETS